MNWWQLDNSGVVMQDILARLYVTQSGLQKVKTNGTGNLYSIYRFLQEDLAISAANCGSSAAPGARSRTTTYDSWQYGLITLKQLDKIYDWLETA